MKNPITTSAPFFLLLFVMFSSCNLDTTDNETPVRSSSLNATGNTKSEELITGYTFSGLEGDAISLSVCREWISNYKKNITSGTQAHFFGHEILKQILMEEKCVGIRMYYAIDDKARRQIILVGVDADGNNLLPDHEQLNDEDKNIVADASFPCPSFCSYPEF